jgi:hypothetical protein
MKIGAENRAKMIAAIGLVVVAVVLLGRWVFSSADSPAARASAAPISVMSDSPREARAKSSAKKSSAVVRSLDPRLRLDWLRDSEDTKYEGTGRNIFEAKVEIPQPIVNPVVQQQVQQGPPPPPPPPPINLKFFGFANQPGEPRKVFLSEGEDVFIAGEGQIVDRRYKILRISPGAVEVEDVLNNNRQSIPLTQG